MGVPEMMSWTLVPALALLFPLSEARPGEHFIVETEDAGDGGSNRLGGSWLNTWGSRPWPAAENKANKAVMKNKQGFICEKLHGAYTVGNPNPTNGCFCDSYYINKLHCPGDD